MKRTNLMLSLITVCLSGSIFSTEVSDQDTLATILGGTLTKNPIENAKNAYDHTLHVAFNKVGEEVWKEPLLALLLQHGEDSLNALTPKNCLYRIKALQNYVNLRLKNPTKYAALKVENEEDQQALRYHKHYVNGLFQLSKRSPQYKSFSTELYKTLLQPGYQDDQFEHFLNGLNHALDGLKNHLTDCGPITLDVYRAYCKGQKHFKEKIKSLQSVTGAPADLRAHEKSPEASSWSAHAWESFAELTGRARNTAAHLAEQLKDTTEWGTKLLTPDNE